ncbi:uncharacterized protein LOC130674251 [Microplitis mediator]|uniref:uncharacterized protein LOC130674251 n=1 Tax=Microplitis mediator TaxID=375433 RepID=UPI002556E028|nr:uncharacterized protein LOC130674251 [Microplitis mediator]
MRFNYLQRELVETCFINNSNPVIITSDLIDDGYKLQNPGDSNERISPIIIINDEFKGEMIKGYVPTYPTYVLSLKSIGKLEAQVDEFRSSAIWSIKSPFLVIDTNKESRCANAGKVLGFLWTMDLLSAYYLCYDDVKDSTIVYTLNPFTNYAPLPWVKVDASDQFDDNKSKKWTLYNLQYSKDETPCKNVSFDKTQELDGHEVKFGLVLSSQKNENIKINKGYKLADSFVSEKSLSLWRWSKHLNVQRFIHFLPPSTIRTIVEKGYIAELANKTLDVQTDILQLADTNNNFSDFITHYHEVTYSILTKKSNYLTVISEMTYNLQFIIMTIVVLLLIALIIIMNNKFDISGGIMDVIKMSAGMGVMSPFDRLSIRIIYLSGFLFIFTVMPEFQGQISAILSKPMRRNIESLKDLYENKFHVYYDELLENDIINEKLWVTDEDKKFLHPLGTLESLSCQLKAQEDSSISYELRFIFASGKIKIADMHTVRELVETCFINNSNPVIITSDFIDNGYKLQNPGDSNGKSSPIIVINDELKGDKIKGYHPTYPTYVLSFDSIEKLEAQVDEFRSSTIWSIKSLFLVIDTNKESRCANAGRVLGFLWTMDLLSAYYLCYDDGKDSTIVYTLNPFTNYAPRPWVKVEAADQFDNNKGKKWTLYNLQYSKDKAPCQNVSFDKTQELDGHEIKFAIVLKSQKDDNIEINRVYNVVDSIDTRETLHSLEYSKCMNVQRLLYFLPHRTILTIVEKGYIAQLANKTIDAYAEKLQLADTNHNFLDYITHYHEITYSILTKKSNYLTVISEMTYNLQFIISTIVVLILIAVIIIVNNKFDISGGIMDVIKMSAGMGVMSSLDRLSIRIIYLSGFLFIFAVMPEFQGQISAILSKPMRRNVESLKDLYENKFHVYYDKFLENDIINEKLWVTDEDKKYLHPLDPYESFNCHRKAQEDSSISCLSSTNRLLHFASKSKYFYVSKEVTFKKYFVYWTRKDWAVKHKLDKIASLFAESGLIHYGVGKKKKDYSKKIKKLNKIEQRGNYDQVDFDHLVFSYMFTGAILLWSLIIFGIEVLFHKHSKICREVRMRRYFRKKVSVRSQPRIVFFPGRMVLLNNRNQV